MWLVPVPADRGGAPVADGAAVGSAAGRAPRCALAGRRRARRAWRPGLQLGVRGGWGLLDGRLGVRGGWGLLDGRLGVRGGWGLLDGVGLSRWPADSPVARWLDGGLGVFDQIRFGDNLSVGSGGFCSSASVGRTRNSTVGGSYRGAAGAPSRAAPLAGCSRAQSAMQAAAAAAARWTRSGASLARP